MIIGSKNNTSASVIPAIGLTLAISTSFLSSSGMQNPTPQFTECRAIESRYTTSSPILKTLKYNSSNTVIDFIMHSKAVNYNDSISLFGEMRNLNDEELYAYRTVISKHFSKVDDALNFFEIL